MSVRDNEIVGVSVPESEAECVTVIERGADKVMESVGLNETVVDAVFTDVRESVFEDDKESDLEWLDVTVMDVVGVSRSDLVWVRERSEEGE